MLTLRRGVTLVEMLIAMTVGAIVLAMVASISLREQRLFADISDRNAVRAQLRDGAATLPTDLRAVSAGQGDIREARDTALEVRATIGTAVVCDTMPNGVLLAPSLQGAATLAAFQSAVDVGDTVWLLDPTTAHWTSHSVVTVASAPAGECAALGPLMVDSARMVPRTSMTLSPNPGAAAVGVPLRITRTMRYSGYRASDGSWYLGQKDWNAALSRFNAIQPVAGPFLSASLRGVWFSYEDSSGTPIATPVADTRVIAMIRVDLRAETRGAPNVLGSTALGPRRDSSSVGIAVRNRL